MTLKNLVKHIRFKLGMAKCHDYIELIENVVDNRSTPTQDALLNKHLNLCLKCLDKLNLDKELKSAIQHKLHNLEVPAGLAESILRKISNSAH